MHTSTTDALALLEDKSGALAPMTKEKYDTLNGVRGFEPIQEYSEQNRVFGVVCDHRMKTAMCQICLL